MPRFPKEEAKMIELAQKIANGIIKNPTTFPNPPVSGADMETDLGEYATLNNDAQNAKAEWIMKVQKKNVVRDRIAGSSKSNITYGELIAKGDNAILQEIAWSVRAAPIPLQPPGQSMFLEIIGQGDGWVNLDWKEPMEGGKVATYVVQRSQNGTSFSDVAPAVESKAVLNNQPSGKYIFQVVALNKAGRGMASNTISITF